MPTTFWHLSSLSAAGLVAPAVGLILSPPLARALGADGRGIYSAVSLPVIVAGIAGTLGIQDGIAYFCANRLINRRAAVRYCLLAIGPLLVVAGAALLCVGYLMYARHPSVFSTYVIVSSALPFQILYNMLAGVCSGFGETRKLIGLRVYPTLLRTVAIVVLLAAGWCTPLTASLALAFCPALTTIWVASRLLRGAAGEATISRGTVRGLTAYSLRCLPGVLASISASRLDQVVGLPLIGERQLGYYAVAVSVAEVAIVIGGAARPLILATARCESGLSRRQRKLAASALAVSAVLCGLLAAVIPAALPAAFGSEFEPAVVPCVILVAGSLVYIVAMLYGAILIANGRAGVQSASVVFGSLVGLLGLVALRNLGATGAALASLTGYGCSAIVVGFAMSRPVRRQTFVTE